MKNPYYFSSALKTAEAEQLDKRAIAEVPSWVGISRTDGYAEVTTR